MSRSYRKHPSFKDYSRCYTKWAKRQASKAVRREEKISDGRMYKKVYPTYSIVDYKWTCYTVEQALDSLMAKRGFLYRLHKKGLVKVFRRESIRYTME